MSRYLNDALCKKVIFRASGICEYCHISLDDTYFGGEIDHILSLKHAGKTILNNLTLACQPCNRNKGTDLGSISEITKKLVRFFNPRTDIWLGAFSRKFGWEDRIFNRNRRSDGDYLSFQ